VSTEQLFQEFKHIDLLNISAPCRTWTYDPKRLWPTEL